MVSSRKTTGGTEKVVKGKALPKPRTRTVGDGTSANRSRSTSSSLRLGPTPELPPYPSNNLDKAVPAFADNRSDLSGSLEYFQELRESVYEENGIIQGCLIGDEEGFKAEHVGEHVVIVRCGWAPDAFPAATEELAESRHQMKCAELRRKHNVFISTHDIEYPIALIIDSQCEHLPIHPLSLPGRYCVMDYFRISNMWAEPSIETDVFVDDLMIKLEKIDLQSGSWWFPPLMRDLSPIVALPDSVHCTTCGQLSPYVYEIWVCLNQQCQHYFCTAQKVPIRVGIGNSPTLDQMLPPTFLESYLAARRTWRIPALQPARMLAPPVQALQVRNSTRGVVCMRCAKCIPRIHWTGWLCSGCGMLHQTGPISDALRVEDIVQRQAYAGHPAVNPQCPPDYNPILGIARNEYRVDRFTLHRDTTVILVSPSQAANVVGGDPIWAQVLADANSGNIQFRRTLLRPDVSEIGLRSEHFHATFGQKYDFSERAPTNATDTPASILGAVNKYIRPLLTAELGATFEQPNSIQALAYIGDEATLPWHTDGDEEVGSLISTLSLGGDALMKIRMQRKYYDHDEFDPGNILVGSRNWKDLMQLHAAVAEGRTPRDVALPLYNAFMAKDDEPRPEIVLPLIHGSVVIIQGKEFTKFFEHEIVSKQSLRFAITQRFIEPELHEDVKIRLQGARQVGQKFINHRGLFTDLPGYVIDEYDVEVDEEVEEQVLDDQQLQLAHPFQSPQVPAARAQLQLATIPPIRQVRMDPTYGNNFNPEPAQSAMVTRSVVTRPTASRRSARNTTNNRSAAAPAAAPTPAPPLRVRVRANARAPSTSRRTNTAWTAAENNILRRHASANSTDARAVWVDACRAALRNAGYPGRTPGGLRNRWYLMQMGSFGGTAIELD